MKDEGKSASRFPADTEKVRHDGCLFDASAKHSSPLKINGIEKSELTQPKKFVIFAKILYMQYSAFFDYNR